MSIDQAKPERNVAEAPTPLNEEEYSSLRNALAVMVLISVVVFALYLLGVQLFVPEFELGIVLAPTLMLLGGWIVVTRRRRRASATS